MSDVFNLFSAMLNRDTMLRTIESKIACVLTCGETVLQTTSAADALFGYEPRELWGSSLELLIPAGVRDKHKSHVERFIGNPAQIQMSERVLPCVANGGESFDATIWLVPADDGQVLCVFFRSPAGA